jgi:hypothetical protein
MDDSFFIYIERLELIAFFSGYPLIFFAIRVIAAQLQARGFTKINIASLLPVSYAVAGLLYLGLQLKNLYPDYSFENIKLATSDPYLATWALLSLLFFIPFFTKKPIFSLLHSLVFFYYIVRDFFGSFFLSIDNNSLRNDMRMYSRSLLINLAAFIVVVFFYFLLAFLKRTRTAS